MKKAVKEFLFLVRRAVPLFLLGLFPVAPCRNLSACTTWVIAPDSNPMGCFILHKNRDYGGGKELPVSMYHVAPVSGYSYWVIALSAINEKGLAIINNSQGGTSDPKHPGGMSSKALICKLANECATVDESIRLLEGLVRRRRFYRALSLQCGTATEAAFIELSSEHLAWKKLPSGFEAHANDWYLPGTAELSTLKPSAKKKCAVRCQVTEDALQAARKGPDGITLADVWRIARLHDEKRFPNQAPYRRSTITGTTFLSDREFPGELSVIFVALGPVVTSVAVPVPTGIYHLNAEMATTAWGKTAFELKRRLGPDHPYCGEIRELEARLLAEFLRAREEARGLLRQGRKTEALALLQALYDRQSSLAKGKMEELLDKTRNAKDQETLVEGTGALRHFPVYALGLERMAEGGINGPDLVCLVYHLYCVWADSPECPADVPGEGAAQRTPFQLGVRPL